MSLMLFVGLISVQFLTMTASAGPIQDIPQGVNEALFDGTNIFAARMILSAGIIGSVMLAMSMTKKFNMLGTGIMCMVLIGTLVAIGWMDYWILVFIGILMATLFSTKVAAW